MRVEGRGFLPVAHESTPLSGRYSGNLEEGRPSPRPLTGRRGESEAPPRPGPLRVGEGEERSLASVGMTRGERED